jgi:hypothetical protein
MTAGWPRQVCCARAASGLWSLCSGQWLLDCHEARQTPRWTAQRQVDIRMWATAAGARHGMYCPHDRPTKQGLPEQAQAMHTSTNAVVHTLNEGCGTGPLQRCTMQANHARSCDACCMPPACHGATMHAPAKENMAQLTQPKPSCKLQCTHLGTHLGAIALAPHEWHHDPL